MAIKRNKYFIGEKVVIPVRGETYFAEPKKAEITNLNYVSYRKMFFYETNNGDLLFGTRNIPEDVLDLHNKR